MNITLPHALHQHFNLRSLSECGNGSKKEAGYRNFKGSIEKERGYQEPMKRINLESRESCQNEALQSAQNTPN